MKKTFKKLLCIALSTAMLFSVCAMYSSALYWREELIPENHTFLEYDGLIKPPAGLNCDEFYICRGSRFPRYPRDITAYYDFRYNQLTLTIENMDAVQEVYAQYEEELNYDVSYLAYDELTLYDKEEKDMENRMPVVQEFYDALYEKGLVTNMLFHEITAQRSYGCISSTMYFQNIDFSEEEAIRALLTEAYGTDLSLSIDPNCYLGEAFRIFGDYNTFTLDDAVEIRDRIKAVYPEADITVLAIYETSSNTVESDPIDLTPAAPASALLGDVNLDGSIDLIDAVVLGKAVAGSVTLSEAQQANSDIDQNDTIDTEDVSLLLRFLLHLEESIG